MQSIFCSIFILLSFGATVANDPCRCRPALEQDWAHGANESVEIRGLVVKRIQGRVLDPHGDAIDDAVVEVFEYSNTDRELGGYQLTEAKKRRTACLTDKNGEFCFPSLPARRYVLKFGTRQAAGWKNTYMTVKLSPHWWRRSGKLEIRLNLGT
jgi:protocatechuate 3,4-dioxygenase beta subunit